MRARTLGLLLWPLWTGADEALVPLPATELSRLAPLLVHSEMAVLETSPEGRPRQLLLLAYAAAPPEVTREVVIHPERYPRFVRNLSKSEVTRQADGSLVSHWEMKLPIGHFGGAYRLRLESSGAVDIRSLARDNHSRWEFLPAIGGGTVIAEYMHYQAPKQNLILQRLISRDPANETGMALATALVLAKSVLAEAQRQAQARGVRTAEPVAAKEPDFHSLLSRGALAIIRSTPTGGLRDVSIVKRVRAPLPRLLELVRSPDRWPSFIRSVTAAKVIERNAQGMVYEMEVDGVILSVQTRYRMQHLPEGADSLGIGGDLIGARMRWDLQREGEETLVTLRANHQLGESSFLLRAMIGYEPLFEHGANVGVSVVATEAIARQAMGK